MGVKGIDFSSVFLFPFLGLVEATAGTGRAGGLGVGTGRTGGLVDLGVGVFFFPGIAGVLSARVFG